MYVCMYIYCIKNYIAKISIYNSNNSKTKLVTLRNCNSHLQNYKID